MKDNDSGSGKVKLATPKTQESATYLNTEPHFAAVEFLGKLDPSLPVHFIFGEDYDLM